MAPSERSTDKSELKKVKNSCSHCKKDVTQAAQCVKCRCVFHPACLRQAADQKKAICVHVEKSEHQITLKPDEEDISTLRNQLKELCNRLAILEESNHKLTKKVAYLEEKWKYEEKLKSKQNSSQKRAGFPALQASKQGQVTAINLVEEVNPMNKPSGCSPRNNNDTTDLATSSLNTPTIETAAILNSLNTNITSKSTLPNKNSLDTSLIIENESELDSKGWITVPKRRVSKLAQKNPRPPPIKGSNEEKTILQVAQRLRWIFVSGLSPKTEATDILTFLNQNKTDHGCVCEKMRTKSKWITSFKLGVPRELEDELLKSDFWPSGVKVNHFQNLKNRRTHKNLSPEESVRSTDTQKTQT